MIIGVFTVCRICQLLCLSVLIMYLAIFFLSMNWCAGKVQYWNEVVRLLNLMSHTGGLIWDLSRDLLTEVQWQDCLCSSFSTCQHFAEGEFKEDSGKTYLFIGGF